MGWRQLSVECDGQSAESVCQWFEEAGALAVSCSDGADRPVYEPPPGTVVLWQVTRVSALFPLEHCVDTLVGDLLKAHPQGLLSPPQGSVLAEQDWVRVNAGLSRPRRFGRNLWVVPKDTAPGRYPGRYLSRYRGAVVRLDPGLAFGTGEHPTTALCLEWLAGQRLSGRTVVDYGCGSGLLAIAALKLGAVRAWATDIDPQALQATRSNAGDNAVSECLHTCTAGQLPCPVDVVLANIVANPLISLARRLARLTVPGGQICLSGLLPRQEHEVAAAYRRYFHLEKPTRKAGWVRLTGQRRDTEAWVETGAEAEGSAPAASGSGPGPDSGPGD